MRRSEEERGEGARRRSRRNVERRAWRRSKDQSLGGGRGGLYLLCKVVKTLLNSATPRGNHVYSLPLYSEDM